MRTSEPRYDADGNLAYLPVRVRTPGLLTRFLAVLPNGSVVPEAEAEADRAARHFARWGSMRIETAAHLVRRPDDEPHALLVAFQEHQRAEVVARARDLGLLVTPLQGVPAVKVVGPKASLVEISRFPASAQTLLADDLPARTAGVTYAQGANTYVYPEPPSSALTTFSFREYNALGIYGRGVRVGIVEAPGGRGIYQERVITQVFDIPYSGRGCRLAEGHEAFSRIPLVEHQNPSAFSCQTDVDCQAPCQTNPGEVPRCRNNQCVSEHMTAVASRIASSVRSSPTSTTSVGYHAAEVTLLIANALETQLDSAGGSRLRVTPERLAEAYNWLHRPGQEAHIINESFETGRGLDFRAWLSDYYARTKGTIFVKAAGNNETAPDPDGGSPFLETACGGFNSVCVGEATADPMYPGRNVLHRLTNRTRWPNTIVAGTKLEQEKPDVVAEGEGGHVADIRMPSSSTQWRRDQAGTSLAAPVVTGLAALMMEACPGRGARGNALDFRAVIRTRGTAVPNALEAHLPPGYPPTCPPPLAYPTPHLGEFGIDCDYKGGTGSVSATYLPGLNRVQCDDSSRRTSGQNPNDRPLPTTGTATSANISVASRSGDLVMGLTWLPIPADLESPSPGQQRARGTPSGGVAPLRAVRANVPTARMALEWDFRGVPFPQGSRVRATLAFSSCPVPVGPSNIIFDPSGRATQNPMGVQSAAASLAPARNLDLVLIGYWTNGAGGSTVREVVAVAEAKDETNEGFDTLLERDFDRLELHILDWNQQGWCATPAFGGHQEPYAIDTFVARPTHGGS